MHAFQQPYDASVSEIDPMDLATPEQDQGKSIGRLTRLMARSLSIVWQSARTPFLALDWAEVTQRPFPNAAGLCSAAGFDGRAGHLGNTGDLWRLVQPVMLLAGLTAVTAVIASVQVGLGRYAAEEVRAFGLARNFGTRLNTLDADYLVILLSTSGTGRGSVRPAALALPFCWR